MITQLHNCIQRAYDDYVARAERGELREARAFRVGDVWPQACDLMGRPGEPRHLRRLARLAIGLAGLRVAEWAAGADQAVAAWFAARQPKTGPTPTRLASTTSAPGWAADWG